MQKQAEKKFGLKSQKSQKIQKPSKFWLKINENFT
jgi:hypothetical protein